jgi:hypothetical protein
MTSRACGIVACGTCAARNLVSAGRVLPILDELDELLKPMQAGRAIFSLQFTRSLSEERAGWNPDQRNIRASFANLL